MTIRYELTRTGRNGQSDFTSMEFSGPIVIIGRGGASELILGGELVAVEHAELSLQEERLFLKDLGASGGTQVNGSRVLERPLQAGDSIRVGSHELIVDFVQDTWVLRRQEGYNESECPEDRAKRLTSRLDLSKRLPSLSAISIVATALVAIVCVWLPARTAGTGVWAVGESSSPHSMIENECFACHSGDLFQSVEDSACRACHNLTKHADALSKVLMSHPGLDATCVTCHNEHSGDTGITVKSDRLCAGCHDGLTELLPEDDVVNVRSFDNHPEFRVTVREPGSDGSERREEVVSEAALDQSTIQLNHDLHLTRGILGPEGPTNLECSDCHELAPGLRTLKPISFEQHCQSCHPLTFEERLPDLRVPHGTPDTVYASIYAAYALLFLSPEDARASRKEFELRSRPGFSNQKRPEEVALFARANIVAEARTAEEELFTRAACHVCHRVTPLPNINAEESRSRFEIVEPEIPAHWYPAAIFSHGSHEELTCESCHSGVKESKETSDLLLPAIEVCQQCHTGAPVQNKIQSDCVLCHSYHDSLVFDPENKRSPKEIFSARKLETKR